MIHLENAPARPEPLWKAMPAEIILVFASNTEVLNVEDLLEEAELPFELVPVPKEVNPNCGLAISFQTRSRAEISAALARSGYKPTAAYLRRGDDFRPLTEVVGPPKPSPAEMTPAAGGAA